MKNNKKDKDLKDKKEKVEIKVGENNEETMFVMLLFSAACMFIVAMYCFAVVRIYMATLCLVLCLIFLIITYVSLGKNEKKRANVKNNNKKKKKKKNKNKKKKRK